MRPPEISMRKGQAFVSDFVVATIIFMIVLALIVFMWDELLSKIGVMNDVEEMEWLSSNAVEQLIKSEGYPVDWYLEPGNARVIGLADSGMFGMKADGVLDADKVMQLINLTSDNYSVVRNRLLSTGKYDFYLDIECLDSLNRECFDGLEIDKFSEGSVGCLNGFSMGVHNGYTDSYVWREVEDYDYESRTSAVSDPGMSADAGRRLEEDGGLLSYDLVVPAPNEYWVWTRYDTVGGGNIDMEISIDGIKSPETYEQKAAPEWRKGTLPFALAEGTHNMTIERILAPGSPVRLDAVIVTSSPGYVPENTEERYYGNFHLISPTTCIIGNYSQQANSSRIVSRSRTATFSSNLNAPVRIRLVMWSGTSIEIPVTTTVTTTSIPAGALLCGIFPSGSCTGGVGEYTCIFSLWQPDNSHAGECGYGARDVCCRVPGEQLSAAIKAGCSAEEGGVISMYGTLNSHVEEYDTGSYDNDVCLGIGGGGEMQCGIYSGSCPGEGNYGGMASIYSTSNSHAASFGYYDNKICCNVSEMPTTTTSTISTTTTTETTSTTSTTTLPALSCSVETGSCSTGTCIFTMYDTSNAHGATCTGSGPYDGKVCCSAGACSPSCEVVSSPSSCSPGYEPVLSLYEDTNAHAQDPDTYSDYTTVICCSTGACGGTLSCGVTDSCTETCLASMASDDNAHLGDCSAYSDKICCTINP